MKKGAASIYVVIVSCLLFGIIAVGFIQLILRERKKSIDNTLSQSAYNSALAGIEDAKLAISEYYGCINEGYTVGTNSSEYNKLNSDVQYQSCANVIGLIETSSNVIDGVPNCDSVTKILKRNGEKDGAALGGEVRIKETVEGKSDTVQAYTCVQVSTILGDYRSTIDSSTPVRIVPFYEVTSNNESNVKKIRISWYSQSNYDSYGLNFANEKAGGSVTFPALGEDENAINTPPVISFSLFQSAHQFMISDLDESNGEKTDRGTVWLVPKSSVSTGTTTVSKSILSESNNHKPGATVNSPVQVSCIDPRLAGTTFDSEFLCSAEIELPEVIDSHDGQSGRYDKSGSFFAAISLPYESPDTDFSVEMLDSSGKVVNFDNVQISVDSTGRANDVFSRVEARLEFRDIYFPLPNFAIEAAGNGSEGIKKNSTTPNQCWYVSNGKVIGC